jgi:pimeloyl-ACP methyl ester carboxylesterase
MQLYYEKRGSGPSVLLLHGMAGSSAYWQTFLDQADKDMTYVVPDLLGFGKSPMPTGISYDYSTHIAAILDMLRLAGIHEPVSIVGHSMGALIALRLAAEHPDTVRRLVLCGLPYYPDIETARRDITQSRRLLRWAYYGRSSQVLCTVWCHWLRPVTRYVAPYYLPRLPRQVAADTLRHTWQSYAESLSTVIEQQTVSADLQVISKPVNFLYGEHEPCGRYFDASGLADINPAIILQTISGAGHQLPLEQPAVIREVLRTHRS